MKPTHLFFFFWGGVNKKRLWGSRKGVFQLFCQNTIYFIWVRVIRTAVVFQGTKVWVSMSISFTKQKVKQPFHFCRIYQEMSSFSHYTYVMPVALPVTPLKAQLDRNVNREQHYLWKPVMHLLTMQVELKVHLALYTEHTVHRLQRGIRDDRNGSWILKK